MLFRYEAHDIITGILSRNLKIKPARVPVKPTPIKVVLEPHPQRYVCQESFTDVNIKFSV